jgi:hypothetical protein
MSFAKYVEEHGWGLHPNPQAFDGIKLSKGSRIWMRWTVDGVVRTYRATISQVATGVYDAKRQPGMKSDYVGDCRVRVVRLAWEQCPEDPENGTQELWLSSYTPQGSGRGQPVASWGLVSNGACNCVLGASALHLNTVARHLA